MYAVSADIHCVAEVIYKITVTELTDYVTGGDYLLRRLSDNLSTTDRY